MISPTSHPIDNCIGGCPVGQEAGRKRRSMRGNEVMIRSEPEDPSHRRQRPPSPLSHSNLGLFCSFPRPPSCTPISTSVHETSLKFPPPFSCFCIEQSLELEVSADDQRNCLSNGSGDSVPRSGMGPPRLHVQQGSRFLVWRGGRCPWVESR